MKIHNWFALSTCHTQQLVQWRQTSNSDALPAPLASVLQLWGALAAGYSLHTSRSARPGKDPSEIETLSLLHFCGVEWLCSRYPLFIHTISWLSWYLPDARITSPIFFNQTTVQFHFIFQRQLQIFLPSLITLWVTNHGGNKHVPAVFITFQTVYLVVACCLPAFPHLALFSKMFFSELHPPRGLCFHPCLFVCLLAGLSAVLHKNYWTDFNKSWREDVSRSRIVFTLQGRAFFLHFH